MRRALLILHRYTGLAVGLLLSLTGITGSLLVFDHALDEKLAPATVAFAPSSERASLEEVLSAARAALPGQPQPERLYLARQPGSPHVVRFAVGEGDALRRIEVSVAPTDARVLAVREWGAYPMSWIYRLHFTLLAGDTGKTVVGVGGLFLLFFCISGAVIWWPRRGRWRRALTVKRGAGRVRFHYDLHKVAGIYLLPVLFIVAFSGVALVFHTPMEKMVGRLLPVDERPAPRSKLGDTALTVDRAVAAAREVFPLGTLKRVYLPRGKDGSYRLAFTLPESPWSTHAASAVWVDRYSGEVLAVRDIGGAAAGSQFLAWQFPLHNGDALGLPGRWLVFVAGWMPALLFVTGTYVWWRKHAAKRRRAERPDAQHSIA